MVNRQQLYKDLKMVFRKNLLNRQWAVNFSMQLKKKYKVPIGYTSDIITQKIDLEDVYDAILYLFVKEIPTLAVEDYFAKTEINMYKDYKYAESRIKFPFTFNSPMIEVRERQQYIGVISVKELMMLRDAQVINYNENTQRSLKHMTGKNFEYYKISLNRKAVNQMMELFAKDEFIPNTLTLNISPDTDFSYNVDGRLTIKSPVAFDILDGYHRYIALSNLYNIDHNFNYMMELRIMFLEEVDARQFIYQEDQKTKMLKVDSEAMNKHNVGMIVSRRFLSTLNSKYITKNIIDPNMLAKVVNSVFKTELMTKTNHAITSVVNMMITAVESVMEVVPTLLDFTWSEKFATAFFGNYKNFHKIGKELYDYTVKECYDDKTKVRCYLNF